MTAPTIPSGFYITAELRARDGVDIDAATQALLAFRAQTRQEPGNRIFTLHQDSAEPARFIFWECFENEAVFQTHCDAPYNAALHALEFFDVVQYFMTDVLPGQSATD